MSEKSPVTLRQKQLLEFAAGSSSGRISVILEARRPRLKVKLAGGTERAELPPVVSKRERRSMQALHANMDELEAALGRLGLAAHARRNDLAGCFVVEVKRQELLELADAPAVQAIRLNQFHRRMTT